MLKRSCLHPPNAPQLASHPPPSPTPTSHPPSPIHPPAPFDASTPVRDSSMLPLATSAIGRTVPSGYSLIAHHRQLRQGGNSKRLIDEITSLPNQKSALRAHIGKIGLADGYLNTACYWRASTGILDPSAHFSGIAVAKTGVPPSRASRPSQGRASSFSSVGTPFRRGQHILTT